MPKVSTISRNEEDFTRERNRDVFKVFRNLNPQLHPFERAREYTRALNAVKLDKVFAKPLVYHLGGHSDGVSSMMTSPTCLRTLVSGACDGEIRVWDLMNHKTLWSVKAHSGMVRGLCPDTAGKRFFSVGTDKTVKIWRLQKRGIFATEQGADDDSADEEAGEDSEEDEDAMKESAAAGSVLQSAGASGRVNVKPISTLLAASPLTAVDHHYSDAVFATAGRTVDIWDETRTEPLHSFHWGADTLNTIKFNKVETQVLLSTASDRSIVLYDTRAKTPLKKLILAMQTNSVAWNPMEAFTFVAANEDGNAYTFDMRKLDVASIIHKDHVAAVMSIDFAPTGKEFVTGSYDKTLRIFGAQDGTSREVYHAKRMQRIFCVKFSSDNKYVLSGSDEMNIRMWKARASEAIGPQLPREQMATNYRSKLKERFQHAPDVRRIAHHRHVPKNILKMRALTQTVAKSKTQKAARVRAHSKPGSVPYVSARKKPVVTVQE